MSNCRRLTQHTEIKKLSPIMLEEKIARIVGRVKQQSTADTSMGEFIQELVERIHDMVVCIHKNYKQCFDLGINKDDYVLKHHRPFDFSIVRSHCIGGNLLIVMDCALYFRNTNRLSFESHKFELVISHQV